MLRPYETNVLFDHCLFNRVGMRSTTPFRFLSSHLDVLRTVFFDGAVHTIPDFNALHTFICVVLCSFFIHRRGHISSFCSGFLLPLSKANILFALLLKSDGLLYHILRSERLYHLYITLWSENVNSRAIFGDEA